MEKLIESETVLIAERNAFKHLSCCINVGQVREAATKAGASFCAALPTAHSLQYFHFISFHSFFSLSLFIHSLERKPESPLPWLWSAPGTPTFSSLLLAHQKMPAKSFVFLLSHQLCIRNLCAAFRRMDFSWKPCFQCVPRWDVVYGVSDLGSISRDTWSMRGYPHAFRCGFFVQFKKSHACLCRSAAYNT